MPGSSTGDAGAGHDGTVTWRQLWAETARTIGSRPQARWLCETASGLDGEELLDELDQPATQRMVAHLDVMLARLSAGEPLQYVLGRWAFRTLDLMIDRRVLIPRPETEWVTEIALGIARQMPRPFTAVDLGTGSGAIGLSLAAELPLGRSADVAATVWLTDVSSDALDVARANLVGLGRRGVNVRFAAGSWFDALPSTLCGTLGLVVANPPYIAVDDTAVEESVRQWEPHGALFSGDDGLDAVREISGGAARWLAPGGWMVLEIGTGQGAAVTSMLKADGLVDVEIRADLAGHDRTVLARRSPTHRAGQAKRAAT
jgi:release factor glutamine methyltransferase